MACELERNEVCVHKKAGFKDSNMRLSLQQRKVSM
jgi:hypothetical protein